MKYKGRINVRIDYIVPCPWRRSQSPSWAWLTRKRALHIHKRALYVQQRSLHILYIHKFSKMAVCPRKSSTCSQEKLMYPQKDTYISAPSKIAQYIRKNALHIRQKALNICRRASHVRNRAQYAHKRFCHLGALLEQESLQAHLLDSHCWLIFYVFVGACVLLCNMPHSYVPQDTFKLMSRSNCLKS